MEQLSHVNEEGKAVMVDVSGKEETDRKAIARGIITLNRQIMQAIEANTAKKGDVLATARIAAIMAVKQTSNTIPLCHPIPISSVRVDFYADQERNIMECICEVGTRAQTGVEMESLHGVSVALLTIYDMCKAISKEMVIGPIRLMSKRGGKSGEYQFGGENQ